MRILPMMRVMALVASLPFLGAAEPQGGGCFSASPLPPDDQARDAARDTAFAVAASGGGMVPVIREEGPKAGSDGEKAKPEKDEKKPEKTPNE